MIEPRVFAFTEPIDVTDERRTECCGDSTNLDGGAHPWQHVSEDGPGDVYRCPECGAVDVD